MRKIEEYFNQAPNGRGWLQDLRLRVNELVLVDGHTYRYTQERGGLDHVLTPAEPVRNK
jgi:hypothetical protein